MPSYFQNTFSRDLVSFRRGDTVTVKLHSGLTSWSGGQFVKWFDDGTGEPCVKKADGRFCGFLAYGSDESADQWNSFTHQNPTYSYGVVTFGGNFFATRTYETQGFLARNGLGPAAALVYTANQKLYVSENGLITNEDESDIGTYGAHNYPDGSPAVNLTHEVFGVVAVPPNSENSSMGTNYIVVQTNLGL